MKRLKANLLQCLVRFDFLIMNTCLKFPQNFYYNTLDSLFTTGTSSLASLSYLPVLQSLKQFIRLISFIKFNPWSSPCLYFFTKHYRYSLLLNFFFKQLIQIKVKPTFFAADFDSNYLQMLITLDSINYPKTLSFFSSLNRYNLHLISLVNMQTENSSWGYFKVHNDMKDFKKFIFLMALIRQVIRD